MNVVVNIDQVFGIILWNMELGAKYDRLTNKRKYPVYMTKQRLSIFHIKYHNIDINEKKE